MAHFATGDFRRDTFAYLRYVVTKFPAATTLDDVEALLPRHADPERLQDATQSSPVG